MEIDFEEETPDGTIRFKGSLNRDEVAVLLRFALLTLLQQGALPANVIREDGVVDEEPPTLQ